MTQNQLTELLETESARALIEAGEERGWIEPAELEAFAVENDLGEPELEEIMRELERTGLEVREPVVEEKNTKVQAEPVVYEADSPSGAGDSLQLFLADVGKHKLLTAHEEVVRQRRSARRYTRQAASSRTPPRRVDRQGLRGLGVPFLDLIRRTLGVAARSRSSSRGKFSTYDPVDPPVRAAPLPVTRARSRA